MSYINDTMPTNEESPVAFTEDVENEPLEDELEVKEWDEGGQSHCGYPDSIHETLMTIGGTMHSFFGEPSQTLQTSMKDIGNYFQEVSYAARDMQRGKLSMNDALTVANADGDASRDDSDVSSLESGSATGDEASLENPGDAKKGE